MQLAWLYTACIVCALIHHVAALQQQVSLQSVNRHFKQIFANASAGNVTANYFKHSILNDHADRQPGMKLHIQRERPCKHWRFMLKRPVSDISETYDTSVTPPPSPMKRKKKQKKCAASHSEDHPFGF